MRKKQKTLKVLVVCSLMCIISIFRNDNPVLSLPGDDVTAPSLERVPFASTAPIEMIRVPAGPFNRGLPVGRGDASESPVKVVEIDTFWIGRTEVTNGQYKEFCTSTKRIFPMDPAFPGFANYFEDFPNRPVLLVSWYDAASFCNWLSERNGLEPAYDKDWDLDTSADGFHLPTEAQWEKAARGSQDTRLYPWGDTPPDQAPGLCNLRGYLEGNPSFAFTAPVNSMPAGASPYGLLHCAGNVWEWCNDWFDPDYYSKDSTKNPMGPPKGSAKVVRGGSWADDAHIVRVTNRGLCAPRQSLRTIGFRVARNDGR